MMAIADKSVMNVTLGIAEERNNLTRFPVQKICRESEVTIL
jgi:hypothetical protein